MEVTSNYCGIVNESLAGERAVDEQTLASLAILSERLERLKGLGDFFNKVDFSTHVKKINDRSHAVPVG
jgi:hypothetical protein